MSCKSKSPRNVRTRPLRGQQIEMSTSSRSNSTIISLIEMNIWNIRRKSRSKRVELTWKRSSKKVIWNGIRISSSREKMILMRERDMNNLMRKVRERREKTVTRRESNSRQLLCKTESSNQSLSRRIFKLRGKLMCITMMICFPKFSSLRFTKQSKREMSMTRWSKLLLKSSLKRRINKPSKTRLSLETKKSTTCKERSNKIEPICREESWLTRPSRSLTSRLPWETKTEFLRRECRSLTQFISRKMSKISKRNKSNKFKTRKRKIWSIRPTLRHRLKKRIIHWEEQAPL